MRKRVTVFERRHYVILMYLFLYVLIIAVFAFVYSMFWEFDPYSFIINERLNDNPFVVAKEILWNDSLYQMPQRVKTSENIWVEINNYKQRKVEFLETNFLLEKRIQELERKEESLSRKRDEELKFNTEVYRNERIQPFVDSIKTLNNRIYKLDKEYERTENATEKFNLIKRSNVIKIELAELEYRKAIEEYSVADNILSNLVCFLADSTTLEYAGLIEEKLNNSKRVSEIDNDLRELRASFNDIVWEVINNRRKQANYWDFLYYSAGIATTTTFGDLVANNRVVRGVVSVQLVLCIFWLAFVLDYMFKEENGYCHFNSL